MIQDSFNVLLIESLGSNSTLITSSLKLWENEFTTVHVRTLEEGLEQLNSDKSTYDVVLTNLILTDVAGHDVVQRLKSRQNPVPVIVLVNVDNEEMGREMLGYGAQDYLSIRDLSPELLRRSIIYSTERERLVKQIRDLSLKDDLTKLYNRRGFCTFAEQQVKITRRTGQKCALIFIDLDNLKHINDTHGHDIGDRAITATADILKQVLRTSDVVSRLGGDEFVVLAPDTSQIGVNNLINRIQTVVTKWNTSKSRIWTLSASIGVTVYDGKYNTTLQELQAIACKEMYIEKKSKKRNLL